MTNNTALKLVPSSQPSPKAKFLLIDDDQGFAKIVMKAAESENIQVTHISSLREVKKNKGLDGFDGVMLDYDLETTTGFAIAEILYAVAGDKPIVMISSTNRPANDKLSAKLPNIKGFVSKWANPTDFVLRAFETLKK